MSGENNQPEPQPSSQSEGSPLEPQPSSQGEGSPLEPQPSQQSESSPSSDIVGRKVFFLYPTAPVKNQVITELVQQEYEVYAAKDHARLSRALKKYSDSVIFINIDEGMPEQEWERWISGIHASLPDIKVGIFSSNSEDEMREKYVNKLNITCGFMALKLDMSKTALNISDVLKDMNVKGRRKYLRASTERESTATLNISYNGEFVNGKIKDISVVGFSCTFEKDIELKKNSFYKDIQLKLSSMLIRVEAVAFGSRNDSGEKTFVLLFTQRIDPDVRVKIRKYIQVNLQNKMDLEIA